MVVVSTQILIEINASKSETVYLERFKFKRNDLLMLLIQ